MIGRSAGNQITQMQSVKESLRNQLETELHTLLDAWFPRSLDREHGGFFCDFDHRWKPSGLQRKMLEYQARQTIAAARGSIHFPTRAFLREAASHGFRYLEETMWDRAWGGWYRMLDRIGNPLESAAKHGHGSSYAISACIACYELTGDPECLKLAKSAFAWLEEHAHDDRHGGYFVFYRQDGTPILSQEREPPSQTRDAIGTPIGFKDANTTSDLLKGFSDLYRVWPDALLRKRLEEMLCILRDRLVVAPGVMHMYAHPDWTPLPDFVRYGQILRSANHLLWAAQALHGAVDPITGRVAKSMVDTMVRVAWDPDKGGFHLAGSSFGPTSVEDTIVFVRDKCWWPQAEGMKAFLAMARLHPADAADYGAHFVHLWRYIEKYIIDAKHGGWLPAGLDTNPAAGKRPKANMWKDCSHEAEALLDCLLTLDSL
jgi:cellobiose epimerase